MSLCICVCVFNSESYYCLELARQNLIHISVVDMTKMVVSVTRLGLNYCKLSHEMIHAILTASLRKGARLRYLGLIRSDLTSVSPTLLAKARDKLVDLNLNYCKVTKEQKTIIKQDQKDL